MSPENPDYARDARRDALENGSGMSPFAARARLGESALTGSTETPAQLPPERGPRSNRRGGRSYEEIGGSDVSRELANEAAKHMPESHRPMSAADKALAKKSIAAARRHKD